MNCTKNTQRNNSALGNTHSFGSLRLSKRETVSCAEGTLSHSNRKFAKKKKAYQIIEEEKERYIKLYDDKLKAKINFLSKLKIKNVTTQENINFNSNEDYLVKNDYLYLVYNSIALQKKFEFDDEYIAIFITNTLDSQFHPCTQNKNKILIKNRKFISGNTINLGYKILIKFFKSLYKDFKVDNNYQKIEFVKVIEAHKDFTPHLHAILYINKEHLNSFERYYNNKVSNNKDLGRSKLEVINNISRSASYILKYVQKDFSSNNNNFKVYYGWKLEHKIRAYTFTRQFIPRDMFNKLSFHLSKKFALDQDSFNEFNTNNFYELIHNFTQVHQTTINSLTGEVLVKEKIPIEDDMFIVKIKKDRNKIDNFHNYKIIAIEKALKSKNINTVQKTLEEYNLFNMFNYFVQTNTSFNYLQLKNIMYLFYVEIFLKHLENKTRYKYSIKDYQIYKKHPQLARYDLVYDKKDWKIVS